MFELVIYDQGTEIDREFYGEDEEVVLEQVARNYVRMGYETRIEDNRKVVSLIC